MVVKKLQEGMIINWEAIAEDPEAFALRGVSTDYIVDEKSHESATNLYKDLELRDLVIDVASAHSRRGVINRHETLIFENVKKHILFPFIELKYVFQVQEGVEELVLKPEAMDLVDRSLRLFYERGARLREKFYTKAISFVELECGNLNNHSVLGNELCELDSRVFREISDILRSQSCPSSPVGDYSKILHSGNLKVSGNTDGFCLYSSNKNIEVQTDDKIHFTRSGKFINSCIDDSIQKAKSGRILSESASLLEYLASIAAWSAKNNFVKPTIGEKLDTRVTGGYHPLLISERRKSPRKPVAHDLFMDRDMKVLAVTGTNMAGKTTFIKEIALYSFLGQQGFFVPAKSATLPLYNRFLTHFGAHDDLMSDKSLFQAEMQRLSYNLDRLGRGTLFVCDELFRGTESGEHGGGRLHAALVESLVQDYFGRTLLSSHYHQSLRQQSGLPNIKFNKFELDERGNPTYVPHEGIAKGGYAVQAALRAGLNGQVAARLNRDSQK